MTLVWRPGFAYDTDASAYIDAVEVADGQALETATRYAINDFVLGCKQDGIWNAIKASCILSGARTLAGALVPLAGGVAPTNVNFVSGDYNRKTGLIGNGSSKYLDSNRNNNADPQNNQHLSVYLTALPLNLNSGRYGLIGSGFTETGNSHISTETSSVLGIHSQSGSGFGAPIPATGLIAITRSNGTQVTVRSSLTTTTYSQASQTPQNANVNIFRFPSIGNSFYSTQRTAFYSIGESLDLALLDNRVSTLIAQFGAVIP